MEQPAEHARYDIGELIGEGGMGSVYLVHDRELDRDVAIKVLRDAAATLDERDRILREARILASLEHPGIVPIHDVGTLPDGRLFYVMKRVRGQRFDDFVREPRSRTELLRAFLQVCAAVAFAHAAGVIHRDLKPQNVMLGAFGEVLVLDWGVARSSRSPAARGTEAVVATAAGTPGYMAPEQMSGYADERADVYGLGGLLFFLLTREHPGFALESRATGRIGKHVRTNQLQRNIAAQGDVRRSIDGSHATGAHMLYDPVVSQDETGVHLAFRERAS